MTTTGAVSGPVAVATALAPADEQVVVLRVRGGDYAAPIGRVQEIIRVPVITAMPAAAPDVEGMINLRGRVLPVINLATRLRLGDAPRHREARVVVVDSEGGGVGLLVDGVSEVLRLPSSEIVPPSKVATDHGPTPIRGVAKLGERLILLLDLDVALG